MKNKFIALLSVNMHLRLARIRFLTNAKKKKKLLGLVDFGKAKTKL
jgi:hypothetical protein